jgi:hypothetical protein
LIGCNRASYEFGGFDLVVSIDSFMHPDMCLGQFADHLKFDAVACAILFNEHPVDAKSPTFGFDCGRLAGWAAVELYHADRVYLLGCDLDTTNLYPNDYNTTQLKHHPEREWNQLFAQHPADWVFVNDYPTVGQRDTTARCVSWAEFEQTLKESL